MHKLGQRTHFMGRRTEYTDGLNTCHNLHILHPLTMYCLLFPFTLLLIHCGVLNDCLLLHPNLHPTLTRNYFLLTGLYA